MEVSYPKRIRFTDLHHFTPSKILMFVLGYDEKMKDAILGTAGPRKIRRRWWSDLGYNQIYHGILPISLHCLARARPRMPVCSSLSIWIWTCRPAEHHPKHSRHSQEYSLELGILGGTSDMGMDQYLLIAVIGGWTSIYQLFWGSPGVQGFDPSPY
jgi:hypothetical protein